MERHCAYAIVTNSLSCCYMTEHINDSSQNGLFNVIVLNKNVNCCNSSWQQFQPHYIQSIMYSVTTAHHCQFALRLSATRIYVIPCTHNNYGDISFSATGLHVWNSLPSHFWQSDIRYSDFKRQLKTYLFQQTAA